MKDINIIRKIPGVYTTSRLHCLFFVKDSHLMSFLDSVCLTWADIHVVDCITRQANIDYIFVEANMTLEVSLGASQAHSVNAAEPCHVHVTE